MTNLLFSIRLLAATLLLCGTIVSAGATPTTLHAGGCYILNFVNEKGTVLKEAETRTGTIGEPVVLAEADRQPFFAGGVKYFYKSDDSNGKTVLADGSLKVTVICREAAVYSYLARGVYEDNDLVFASGSVIEGESVTVRPPKYILLNGTTRLLVQSASSPKLAITITPDTDNYSYEVRYRLLKDNVVFFSEAEDVKNLTKTIDDVYCKDRLSGGAGAYSVGASVPVASIPCGRYRMFVGAMGGTGLDFTANADVICTAMGSGNSNKETVSDEFTLDERTVIYLEPGGNGGKKTSVAKAIDYIYIEQIEKGSCEDSGEGELPDPITVPDLRIVEQRVFKDISVLKAARETYSRPTPAGVTRKEGKPVIFYIGDSTTRNGTAGDGGNGKGEWGWAFFSQMWFDPNEVVCENHALGGMSSRSFYRDRWADVKEGIRPGDYVVIGFGHNDGGKNWDTRSAISGTSSTATKEVTNTNGDRETVYSFGQYLRFFVDETIALGATPILCSMTSRGMGEGSTTPSLNHSQRIWTKEIAEEKGVSFIDLGQKAYDHYLGYGAWKVAQFFSGSYGGLHTNLRGAWENAWYHALCIYEDAYNPLHNMVLDPTQPKLDINRVDGQPYTFVVGGGGETSARDCFRSGDWHLVYNSIEAGDIVKMKFGASELSTMVKDKELGCVQSADDELQRVSSTTTGRHEQVGSYGWYIHYFSNDVLEKGGIPVIVTAYNAPTEVRKWNVAIAERLGIRLEVEEKPTAIGETILQDKKKDKGTVYNIAGLPQKQHDKGIFIIDGQKIMKK